MGELIKYLRERRLHFKLQYTDREEILVLKIMLGSPVHAEVQTVIRNIPSLGFKKNGSTYFVEEYND